MSFRIIKSMAILAIFLSGLQAESAHALVAQSASSALRSDIFVKDNDSALSQKRQKEFEKRRKEELKKREAEQKKAQKKLDLQQKLNKLKQAEQARQGEGNMSNDDIGGQREEIERQIQQLNISTENTDKTSNASDIPYTKSYASKLFQTYSGHITIEQKNIPTKIAVTKGSTIQLNLENKPGTIWYVVNDDKIARIKSNKENGAVRSITLEAVGKGATKLIFDNILTQDNNYKVLTTKRMRLIVDNEK